jgi:uncharacterized protein involved in exopolysaccharide biosynthesis
VPESLDGNQYFQYLLRRWRFIVSVCAIAVVLALVVSVVLPKSYTATASLLIEPPAGNDPRTSIAVSPVYLESLRSYEVLASSDTLLTRALDKFHLRDPQSPEPLETIKRRILKVSKPRETKILQISVTLADPRQAQAVAQFLAEETVSLSRGANRDSDQDLLGEAQKQVDDTAAKLEAAQTAFGDLNIREPIEPMRASLQALTDLQARVRQDLSETRAQAAELASSSVDPRAAGAKARADSLEKQDAELTRQIKEKAVQLSRRSARDDEARQKLRTAQTNYDSANLRLREVRGNSGLRGERLRVVEPSVIPERPSSPNLLLNLALALGVGLVGAVVYLTLTLRPNES